ncbi:glycosyltransferase family 2 protein [Liquorilactobacillus mali]|uniref:Glycosyl transferase 2 n=1 Tax=Liquorilactobacillus mali KCTC 3596 = DSM 20444 TaxID=1046596 RepID=J1F602_9LACO|nr:glycosyltransferase family 2 protein [Liquorilactobacillus mali]EJF02171.1 glycosyl transferase 2 [Liquorilactobacillus mali KCTC 3596 = DSM 20444]KRN10223.1 glycosyl transferase 2 [Liquorilactobacillus mali KCTC 3596 = DSM 20444]MDC7952774.1 glycosyltransferase family 2 protein [Liquorilactobacillus mali]MDV7757954.1 glycosyltransferase [Liquorilactobacillus mali]QFQ74494.1 glycosyltransferase family 2 protein [Liquorilactobacillus mali]
MSFKKALHCCIRRTQFFIDLSYEQKTGKELRKSELKAGIIGAVKLASLWAKRNDYSQIKYNLSMTIILKNEAPYIREWLAYYTSIGVEHFYIYDNDSQDDLKEIIDSLGDKVTYVRFSGIGRQMDAYNDALNKYGRYSRYMGFLDADEFIYLTEGQLNFVDFLNNYFADPHVGGFVINWQIFGSSFLKKKPHGLVTNNFVYRARKDFKKNFHIKSIVDPRKVAGFFNDPHGAYYLPSYYAVNEKKQKVDGPFSQSVNTDRIQINHYFTKSEEEFIQKKSRGRATKNSHRTMQDFVDHDKNDVFDDSIKTYNQRNKLE